MVPFAATAIGEQTVDVCTERSRSAKRGECLTASPISAARKEVRLNRISHPDWAKLCVNPNGWIKLRAKRKCKFLVATVASRSRDLVNQSCLLLASCLCWTYLTENSHWTKELRSHNLPKMFLIYLNMLSGRREYFFWHRKMFTPQNSR